MVKDNAPGEKVSIFHWRLPGRVFLFFPKSKAQISLVIIVFGYGTQMGVSLPILQENLQQDEVSGAMVWGMEVSVTLMIFRGGNGMKKSSNSVKAT
jgi:hypothetical protein